MMTIPSDELLAAASASGDHEAFDRLALRYGSELDGYFRRRLPDDGRIEELRQETLLALLSLLPSYRERGRFRSLVFSIAYRKLVSARRAEHPSSALTEDVPAPGRDPDAIDVRRALERLPEPLREALFLTALEGLSSGEAGEVLGCSADAVRARTCRARAAVFALAVWGLPAVRTATAPPRPARYRIVGTAAGVVAETPEGLVAAGHRQPENKQEISR